MKRIGYIVTEIEFEDNKHSHFYGEFTITQTAHMLNAPKVTKGQRFDGRYLLTLLDSGYLVEMLKTHKSEIDELVNGSPWKGIEPMKVKTGVQAGDRIGTAIEITRQIVCASGKG